MAHQPSRVIYVKEIIPEEQLRDYLTYSCEDKWIHAFLKGISSILKVMARLEFELAY